MTTKLKVAHSPDSDDAFMFYAIKEHKIDLYDLDFEFSSAEIAILNQELLNGNPRADIMAASFHTYALIKNDYALLDSGMSFANKDHGPKIVCKNPNLTKDDLSRIKIAVPGKNTTAFLVLKEIIRHAACSERSVAITHNDNFTFCEFDKVFDLLESGKVDAALLIHEAQLKYQDYGYKLLVDLGAWWHEHTDGLDLPLGCNVASKKLGPELIKQVDEILSESISWGQKNFQEVMDYSRAFANNGLDDARAKQYLETYVLKSCTPTKKQECIDKILALVTSSMPSLM